MTNIASLVNILLDFMFNILISYATYGILVTDVYIRVGPDSFLAGYRIPDIRLIVDAGYPVSGRLPDIRPDNRILR